MAAAHPGVRRQCRIKVERDLIQEWLQAMTTKGLKVNSISAYEQSILRFCTYLRTKGIALKEVKGAHVSDFILDRYQRGNSKITVEHYVDCARQFFKHHRKSLRVTPGIFNIYRVRKAFDCFQKSGISKPAVRTHEYFNRGGARAEELKRAHSKSHPRG